MGGYTPGSREGLIALMAMRRIKAEKLRREKLAQAKSADEIKTLKEAGKQERKSGWFRR